MADYEKFKEAVKQMILNLPDWAKNQQIMVLAGMELLVYYVPGDKIQIKKVRCNFCGDCCLDYPDTPYGVDDEGKCNKLEFDGDKWICLARFHKPYNCLHDPLKENVPDCNIEHDPIDI